MDEDDFTCRKRERKAWNLGLTCLVFLDWLRFGLGFEMRLTDGSANLWSDNTGIVVQDNINSGVDALSSFSIGLNGKVLAFSLDANTIPATAGITPVVLFGLSGQ